MEKRLNEIFSGKHVALLGLGREGRSSYETIRRHLPNFPLTLLDSKEGDFSEWISDVNTTLITGRKYLETINEFDLVIKSPGIPYSVFPPEFDFNRITSQTDLFLNWFNKQAIGVTGTKGKSTTVSLIHHILQSAGRHSILVGNIGIPPFSRIDEITEETLIVMELSSHQLEFTHHAPYISVLLNIFQEHLDHYASYAHYQQAKLNIGVKQQSGDYLIYNTDNELLAGLIRQCLPLKTTLLPYSLKADAHEGISVRNNEIFVNLSGKTVQIATLRSGIQLRGEHNTGNIMAASACCFLAGLESEEISTALETFRGLPHRMEFAGEYDGIYYYNDSIATIPEATMEAVKTLQEVDTLILGGFDRGIDYSMLVAFLTEKQLPNLIFTGPAGQRILDELTLSGYTGKTFLAKKFRDIFGIASRVTRAGKICLLSPSAASYNEFENFEERGNFFKKNVGLLPHTSE